MVKETINNIVEELFLSDIIAFIPMKAKIKRKTIEGMIQKKLPEREQAKLDISQYLNFEDNNEIVSWFVETLEQEFPHCNLQSLYKNIQTLKFVEKDKSVIGRLKEVLSLRADAAGKYSLKKNRITVYFERCYDFAKNTKLHELVHFATTRKEKDITLCGFEIEQNDMSFGRGLNEGYTEWFTKRHLLKEDGGSYEDLQIIASGIEELIGPKKMQQYFFTNDLNGLVTEMEKYTTRQNALTLIEKMDRINNWYGKPGGQTHRDRLSREARVDVANMIQAKNKKLLSAGTISEENYKNSLFWLEQYTHGLRTVFYGKSIDNIEEAIIKSYIDFDTKAELKYDEYTQLRTKYLEDKKFDSQFTYKPWLNQDGLTIEQSFIAIEERRRQTELNEMFIEQNTVSVTKESDLKKW